MVGYLEVVKEKLMEATGGYERVQNASLEVFGKRVQRGQRQS